MQCTQRAMALALVTIVWIGWIASDTSRGEIRFGGDIAGLYTYDFEDRAELAGTAFVVIRDSTLGVTFGEKLTGQINTATDHFDFFEGPPELPLTVDDSIEAEFGLSAMSFIGSTIIVGLGPLGFPDNAAIGEGTVTVLFDMDQRLIAFDVFGANPGPLVVDFYDRAGNLLGHVEVFEPPNETYVYSSDKRNIAAVVLNNHDYGGLGFGNFLFIPGTDDRAASCSVNGPYEFDDENQVVIVPLGAGHDEAPDSSWTFLWTTDCSGAIIEDTSALVTTMEVPAPDGCSVECTVALIVDKGYEKDICSSDVTISGDTGATVECPPDTVVESDGAGNLDDLEAWLSSVDSTGDTLYNDFDGVVYECNNTSYVTTTWWVEPSGEGGCGGDSECTGTFAIVDTTSPELTVDSTTVVVEDADCDGVESVTLPEAWASDAGDGEVEVTNDAPEFFPVGTTTVTYTATDECGNTSTATVEVTVVAGAGVEVDVTNRSRGSRGGGASIAQPLAGISVTAFDVSPQSCGSGYARTERGLSRYSADAIVANCQAVATATTDADGFAVVGLGEGRYLVVAALDTDGDGNPDTYLSQPTGDIKCGNWKQRHLERLLDMP